MNSKKVETAYAELWGILYAVLALLLILSLASYDSLDIGINTANANKQINNAIGLLGAALSWGLYSLVGLVAWMFPLLSISASAVFFTRHSVHWGRKLIWSGILVISAASLMDLQTLIGGGWSSHANMFGVGGVMGDFLNHNFLLRFLGRPGSAIIMFTSYLTSLVLLFEIRPAQLAVELHRMILQEWEDYQESKMGKTEGKLASAQRRLDREQRELEETLARQRKTLEPRKKAETDWRPARAETPASGVSSDVPESANGRNPAALEPAIDSVKATLPVPPDPPAKPAGPRPAAKAKDSEPTLPPPVEVVRFDDDYELPSLNLLAGVDKKGAIAVDEAELKYNLELVVYTLKTFGIEVDPVGFTPGATITRYEVLPRVGVRVDKITSLQRDLARSMKAERINILAPVPGKNTVGIEIPNTSKVPVVLRELFETVEWKSTRAKIPLALGKDVYGATLIADLADMPHLLIAGTTGSGKSVCINCVLLSLLYRFSPNELRLILVDPKQVEMQIYNSIPHLVVPVVVEPKKVLMALRWVIGEMEKRYKILARTGVRNITAFNNRPLKPKDAPKVAPANGGEPVTETNGAGSEETEVEVELFPTPPKDDLEIPDRLPFIVVIIDELADLMQTAPADVESAIARLTAKARAAGIHLIVATQTPRREVVTGVIKTNIPCRIAFQVPSALDSRVILDESGAENLLGKGDMLYLPPGSGKFTRGQGAFVGDEEVHRIVEFCSNQSSARFENEIHHRLSRTGESDDDEVAEEDQELIKKCLEVIRQEKRASTSMLQRRLRIGYNRAAWVIDWLERKGILAPSENPAKPRDIQVDLDQVDPEKLF